MLFYYEKLKKYCLEEWNKIDLRNFFKNYSRRVNMVLTLNGDRILDHHIKQIRKIEKKEKKEKEEREKEEEENEEDEEEEEEKNVTEIGNRKIKEYLMKYF